MIYILKITLDKITFASVHFQYTKAQIDTHSICSAQHTTCVLSK